MDASIRIYSREELLFHDVEWLTTKYLEIQNKAQELLLDYTDLSQKLRDALESINLLNVKLYGKSTETSSSLGIDSRKHENNLKSTDAETDNESSTLKKKTQRRMIPKRQLMKVHQKNALKENLVV